MKPVLTFLFMAAFGSFLPAMLVNPIIDSDKSVNTNSVETIVADLTDNSMSDEEKLLALFTFHRRMMHHYRLLQSTEDNTTTFDIIKLYTVYGCSFCTQQAVVFRTLCSEIWGRNYTGAPGGSGPLASTGEMGGHTTFEVRFSQSDSWHWVDPIIGAWARNKTNGRIASLQEIQADPTILNNAKADGRASVPYFPCTTDPNSIPDSLVAAYGYWDYDPGFIIGFSNSGGSSSGYSQNKYFTTKKYLKKGETYLWLWDYLPGNYFNLQDQELGVDAQGNPTRDWEWYPPRHICGWKDSLDTSNWPYFKPYKKVINGDTCYRYYANGIHTFAPDLATAEPKDAPWLSNNVAFYADDNTEPRVKPAAANTMAELAYRLKLPYPLMSMKINCDYVKKNAADTLILSIARLYFRYNDGRDSITREVYPAYQDTLSPESFREIKVFGQAATGTLDTTIREFVDPLNTGETYQGYIVKFSMKTGGAVTDVGVNSFKVECIFQHNMFALTQLEPGPNVITVTADTGNPALENLNVYFSWMDNGVQQVDSTRVPTSPYSYTLNVAQAEMPRMKYMAVSNAVRNDIGIQTGTPAPKTSRLSLYCFPNPFNAAVKIAVSGQRIADSKIGVAIYDIKGKMIQKLPATSYQLSAGISWNASGLPAGIYIARVKAGGRTVSKRIILIK